MNFVRRLVLTGLVAAPLAVSPLFLSTAYAGPNPSTTPVGCGLNPDDQGYASWTQRTFRTENDNLYCYYVYISGHFYDGSSYYWVEPTWAGGYPASVESGLGPSGTVEASGSHNACLSDWTGCNGYTATLSYQ